MIVLDGCLALNFVRMNSNLQGRLEGDKKRNIVGPVLTQDA